jgi:beta-glucosidase
LVGYRWFDTKNIAPAFCFGHGLSYTDFTFGNMQTDKPSYAKNEKITLSLKVKNTGNRDGYETVQLYISELEPKVLKPAKELKAFKKVLVPAGAEIDVPMEIPIAELAWFDEKIMNWVVSPGNYQLAAGSSSKDIRKVVQVKVK